MFSDVVVNIFRCFWKIEGVWNLSAYQGNLVMPPSIVSEVFRSLAMFCDDFRYLATFSDVFRCFWAIVSDVWLADRRSAEYVGRSTQPYCASIIGFRCFPMLSSVCRCLSLFSVVFQCFPMLFDAFRCFTMFSDVFRCLAIFSDVFRCFPMRSDAIRCYPMFLADRRSVESVGGSRQP